MQKPSAITVSNATVPIYPSTYIHPQRPMISPDPSVHRRSDSYLPQQVARAPAPCVPQRGEASPQRPSLVHHLGDRPLALCLTVSTAVSLSLSSCCHSREKKKSTVGPLPSLPDSAAGGGEEEAVGGGRRRGSEVERGLFWAAASDGPPRVHAPTRGKKKKD